MLLEDVYVIDWAVRQLAAREELVVGEQLRAAIARLHVPRNLSRASVD